MPISSTHQRLTQEQYRPPPKSLEQLRFEDLGNGNAFSARSNFTPTGSNMVTPTGSPMMREKHLLNGPHKKTAVVEPLAGSQKSPEIDGVGNGNGFLKDGGAGGMAKNAGIGNGMLKFGGDAATKGGAGAFNGAASGATAKSAGCCLFHGMWCTRCCWLIFLLGLLLGALITGLAVGLVLGGRLEELAAASATTATPEQPVGCFQSPCPSANAVCSSNGTTINCVCQSGNPVSSAAVTSERYTCSLFNDTAASTSNPMMTMSGP